MSAAPLLCLRAPRPAAFPRPHHVQQHRCARKQPSAWTAAPTARARGGGGGGARPRRRTQQQQARRKTQQQQQPEQPPAMPAAEQQAKLRARALSARGASSSSSGASSGGGITAVACETVDRQPDGLPRLAHGLTYHSHYHAGDHCPVCSLGELRCASAVSAELSPAACAAHSPASLTLALPPAPAACCRRGRRARAGSALARRLADGRPAAAGAAAAAAVGGGRQSTGPHAVAAAAQARAGLVGTQARAPAGAPGARQRAGRRAGMLQIGGRVHWAPSPAAGPTPPLGPRRPVRCRASALECWSLPQCTMQ